MTTLNSRPHHTSWSASAGVRPALAEVPQTDLVELSVVMPCLNEEGSVGICVEKTLRWFERAGITGEVIVVDNGSDDHSVVEASGAGARVIFESRQGYGSALRRGIASSQGRYVIMGDCDDTYDFEALDPIVEALRAGVDLCVGNRYAGGIQPGAMTWSHRYLGTPVLSFLVRLFSHSDLGDSQCGLRGFSRVAYDRMELSSDGMEFASEMIIKAARLGLSIHEVPITYRPRIGETKLNTLRDGWRHLRYLLLATPVGLYTVPGLMLALLGAAILALGLVSADGVVGIAGLAWEPVYAGSILLMLGINALMFGGLATLYTSKHGITPNGGLIERAARAVLRFERALVGASLLIVAGVGIELFLAVGDVASIGVSHRAGLAAIGQALILTAGSFGLSGFLGSTIADTSCKEPGS